jgi:hypothetical protein
MLVGRISGCEAQRVIPYAAKRFVFVNPYCHSAGLVSPARLRCPSLPGGAVQLAPLQAVPRLPFSPDDGRTRQCIKWNRCHARIRGLSRGVSLVPGS